MCIISVFKWLPCLLQPISKNISLFIQSIMIRAKYDMRKINLNISLFFPAQLSITARILTENGCFPSPIAKNNIWFVLV